MHFSYRFIDQKTNALTNVALQKKPFGHSVQVVTTPFQVDQKHLDLSAMITLKNGEEGYSAGVEMPNGPLSVSDAQRLQELLPVISERVTSIENDLNQFRQNPQSYVDKIRQVSFKKDLDKLNYYLPMVSNTLNEEQAKEALKAVARSGIAGDLTKSNQIGRVSPDTLKGLTCLCETIPGVFIADEAPHHSISDVINAINKNPHSELSIS